jgi:hypothetical protein
VGGSETGPIFIIVIELEIKEQTELYTDTREYAGDDVEKWSVSLK